MEFQSTEAAVDEIIKRVGKKIVIGMPLGLGKPNHLINILYRRAKQDPGMDLTILTALSLEKPRPGSDMEKRFLGPFVERVFGDYEDLEYVTDLRKREVPDNITVHEFFYKSGAFLANDNAQQNYISTNYTHAPRDIMRMRPNVLAQMISRRDVEGEAQYSLSCNPEVALDMMPEVEAQRAKGRPILVVGQVHRGMPFMVNDAQVGKDMFDIVIDHPEKESTLFGAPYMSLTTTDYMIGFHASSLIQDNGTLQIGIGSLGDAIVYATKMRHEDNAEYNEMVSEFGTRKKFPEIIDEYGGTDTFQKGLYGNSEMFVSGFMNLYHAGILKKRVYDHAGLQRLLNEGKIPETVRPEMLSGLLENGIIQSPLSANCLAFLKKYGIFKEDVSLDGNLIKLDSGQEFVNDLNDTNNFAGLCEACLGSELKGGIFMHGGFFLGPNVFYQQLRDLSEEERAGINMTRISYTNGLYGDYELKVAQRQKARLINTVFKATLMGAGVSDGLSNGQVVSGVGGQYNFVAMAHELPDARSILLLKSTRHEKDGSVSSNIVFNYGHVTIPRHLRDVFITEYGIADVRGKSDSEVIKAMLNISDSRFQNQLMHEAKTAGKLQADYQIPEMFTHNYPENLEKIVDRHRVRGFFPPFPFGCDFTDEELVVGKALKRLKATMEDKMDMTKALASAAVHFDVPDKVKPYLKRMGLDAPKTLKERLEQQLLVRELESIVK